MKTRGKVLRPPNGHPGLLIIDGQQYKFSMGEMWKADALPKPGLSVEVEMNQGLEIVGITMVPESQPALETVGRSRERGILTRPLARIGARDLTALCLLVTGWFLLTTITLAPPGQGVLNFTFWQVLALVNSRHPLDLMTGGSRPGAGLYGLLALLALAGTLVHRLWRQRIAVLGGSAPLLLMIIVWVIATSDFQSAFRLSGQFGRVTRDEAMHAITLGLGAYLSGLMSLYFAVVAVREFLAPAGVKAHEEELKVGRAAA